MPSVLISGPAGAGKSQRARELLAEASEPTVLIEFQPLYAQLLGIERLPSGRYPERQEADAFGIPLTTQVRLGILAAARAQEVAVIMTTSDGDRTRRDRLLSLLPFGAREEVIDPGRLVVEGRLTNEQGLLSEQCRAAIDRWYSMGYGRVGPFEEVANG